MAKNASNGVGDVGIGLGNKKYQPKDIIAGPGTVTLHFPWQDMGALMAAHGQFLESLVAGYPVDPREQAAATVLNQSAVTKGWTRMTFSNARIMSLELVPGGAVQVTVHHFGATQGPPVQAAAFSTTKQNVGVKTNSSKDVGQWLVPSPTPWKVFSTNLNSSRSGM